MDITGQHTTTNNGIIKGSHNTMSYLPPRHWWMRPFRAIARCQSRTLLEQLDAGAEAVDLRVCFDRRGVARVLRRLQQAAMVQAVHLQERGKRRHAINAARRLDGHGRTMVRADNTGTLPQAQGACRATERH